MANEFVTRRGIVSLGGVTFPYVAIGGTYTILEKDYFIDATSGTFTVTLPISGIVTGRIYIVKNSGSGIITVSGGGNNIDGNTTKTLKEGNSLQVHYMEQIGLLLVV
jgi:hypothetical protein